jgi:hypothetical protein
MKLESLSSLFNIKKRKKRVENVRRPVYFLLTCLLSDVYLYSEARNLRY